MILSIKKKQALGPYTSSQLFWGKIQSRVNQVPLCESAVPPPKKTAISISPHNEGNNKRGCNDVPVQIRSAKGVGVVWWGFGVCWGRGTHI